MLNPIFPKGKMPEENSYQISSFNREDIYV